jgi:hypothetical protein
MRLNNETCLKLSLNKQDFYINRTSNLVPKSEMEHWKGD